MRVVLFMRARAVGESDDCTKTLQGTTVFRALPWACGKVIDQFKKRHQLSLLVVGAIGVLLLLERGEENLLCQFGVSVVARACECVNAGKKTTTLLENSVRENQG